MVKIQRKTCHDGATSNVNLIDRAFRGLDEVKDTPDIETGESVPLPEKSNQKKTEQVKEASPHEKPADKVRKKSLREQYVGKTPGKKSKTGREVILKMKSDGKIKDTARGQVFLASNEKWYPISEADMSHTKDAVTWWNNEGRKYGPKHKKVREFMLDSNNYELDHYSLNRSEGAKLGETYKPPIGKDEKKCHT